MNETWADAVLAILRRRPKHPWTLDEIYVEIEHQPIVAARHREKWGGQPNYHHWVRSTLARLKADGKVIHVGRARYQLGV